jgi:hypothetical protein
MTRRSAAPSVELPAGSAFHVFLQCILERSFLPGKGLSHKSFFLSSFVDFILETVFRSVLGKIFSF